MASADAFNVGLETIAGLLKQLEAPLLTFTARLTRLVDETLVGLGRGVEGVSAELTALSGGLAAGVAQVSAAFVRLPRALDPLAASVANVAGVLGAFPEQLRQLAATVSGPVRAAFAALPDAIGQIASIARPFVDALNPTLMAQLGLAFRGLQATIGVALAPMVSVLTQFTRQVSGLLLPAMQALAPVVGNISQSFANILAPAVGMFADMLQAIAPILEFLSGILRAFSEGLQVYYTVLRSVFQTFVQTLSSLFGGVNLKDALKSFQDTLRQVVSGMVQMIAFLARAMGATGFIDNLISNFKALAQPAAGQAPAPQAAGITSAESIMKEMQTAAFTAMGGGAAPKSEKDYLEQLAKSLEEIKNGKSFQAWLDAELKNIPTWMKEGVGLLWQEIQPVLNRILGAMTLPALPDSTPEPIRSTYEDAAAAAGLRGHGRGSLRRGPGGNYTAS